MMPTANAIQNAERGAAPALACRGYVVIALLAVATRAAWGVWRLTRGGDAAMLEFPDEQQYWLMAQSLWHGEGLVDELGFRATRMPLYPALLSIFTGVRHGLYAATACHWLLGTASAVLTANIGQVMFDRRVAMVGGLLVAVDPFLVFSSSLLLTETLYIVLMLALWRAAWSTFDAAAETITCRRWVAIGVLAAATVYARESGLGLVILLMMFLLLWRRDRTGLVGVAVVGMIVVISLLPWAIRNRHTIGHLSFLTQRGGISLYDGVGPQATGRSDLGDVKQMTAVRGMDEVAWNRYFLKASFDAMRRDPWRIVKLAGRKLARMWNPVPNVETYRSPWVRAVGATWSIPTFALALWGAVHCAARSRSALLLLLPAIYLCLLHSLFVGSIRYRLSAVPLLHVLAGVSVVALWARYRTRRAQGEVAP